MKTLFIIIGIAIAMNLNAQLSETNFIGKSSTEIYSKLGLSKLTGNFKSGEMYVSYYDQNVGSLVYIFDNKNICSRYEIHSCINRLETFLKVLDASCKKNGNTWENHAYKATIRIDKDKLTLYITANDHRRSIN
jgi:hypothetical protein